MHFHLWAEGAAQSDSRAEMLWGRGLGLLLSITARTPGCLLAIQYDLKEAIGNTHCFMANHSQTLPSQPGLCGDLTVTGICVGGSGACSAGSTKASGSA